VAIRTSASQEVKRLVADVISDGPDQATRRDAAIARLTVIGTRAVRQILDAIAAKPPPAQHASLLLALEAIPDPRTVDPVVQGLGAADAAVRLAAARAARGLLALPQGTIVLDRLTTIALDCSEQGDLRVTALDALSQLPARTVKPVLDRLKDDPSPEVKAALRQQGAVVEDPIAELEEASDGWLPRDPHVLLQLVGRDAGRLRELRLRGGESVPACVCQVHDGPYARDLLAALGGRRHAIAGRCDPAVPRVERATCAARRRGPGAVRAAARAAAGHRPAPRAGHGR